MEKINHSREINQGWKVTGGEKRGWCGVKFKMSLTGVCSLSRLGEGGLEVRGHGHWQDLPLDVCPGVHTGISRTLSASLAGWNDLEACQAKEQEQEPARNWQEGCQMS